MQDLHWLEYSLRFLECNWEGESEVVVVLDENCRGEINPGDFALDVDIHYVTPWKDGYCHAMYIKTLADTFCEGDLIALIDSDCMLMEPAGPDYFLDGDNEKLPVIPYLTYEEHLKMYPHSPWKAVTEKVMQEPTHFHYMAREPIAYWRQTFARLREHLESIHKLPYEEIVYSAAPFEHRSFLKHPLTLMDYDLLGFYAHHYEPTRYLIEHLRDLPKSVFHQYHSWTMDPTGQLLDRALQGSFSRALRTLRRELDRARAKEMDASESPSTPILDSVEESRPGA